MNLDLLREFGRQLGTIWKGLQIHQKFTLIMVATFLLGMLGFVMFQAASTRYVPLYEGDRLGIADAAEIKSYLDSSRVAYKIKGDSLIMVSSEDVHRIRMDLAAIGLPKIHNSKGFELFDSNTWIKGEKELQVMEMRAIKGQLERDITAFENIQNANVILDIAAPRPFAGSMYKTKASVILQLMPGARLSNSQLRSITYHVAGAVRGLDPNMVAISDTTGRLYQSLDPDGDTDMLRSAEISVEERLKAKIDGMLAMVVGQENFYSTVQVTMNREKRLQERKVFQGNIGGIALGEPVVESVTESGLQTSEKERSESGTPGSNPEAIAGAIVGGGQEILNRSENRTQQYRQMAVPVDHVKVNSIPGKIVSISIGVLIDKTITIDPEADVPQDQLAEQGKRNAELIKKEVLSQLAKVLEGYGVETKPAVDFVEFDRARINKQVAEQSWSSTMDRITQAGTVGFIVLVVAGMFWSFNRFWRRHMYQPPQLETEEIEEPEVADEPTLVELEAMVESIKTRIQSEPESVVEVIRDLMAADTSEEGI